MKKYLRLLIVLSYLPLFSTAQTIPINDGSLGKDYPFIHPALNRIFAADRLDSFYRKLSLLGSAGKGVVNIIHIGDSHIQADFLSAVVRYRLQQFFGNGGRGLIFPYQLAQTNSPDDLGGRSNTNWQFNRIAHPEISLAPGVSGYAIRTSNDSASLTLALNNSAVNSPGFKHVKLFFDSLYSGPCWFKAENNDTILVDRVADTLSFSDVVLDEPANQFTFGWSPGNRQKDFYGAYVDNSGPGVIYSSIGVNGARYDHYNQATLFWQQLKNIPADLIIVSLGTNEAQNSFFNETAFLQQVDILLKKIAEVAPNIPVLITTAPDSYKARKPNNELQLINTALRGYCERNNLPCWDLYSITNGHGSAYNWMKKGLMNRDRVHFTAEGYRIQGTLFFNALAKGYNSFINRPSD